MTTLLDVNAVSALLHKEGLGSFMGGIESLIMQTADRLADAYRRWDEFAKRSRIGIHSVRGDIELMPVADHHYYAFKYVTGFPQNPQRNLPNVMAFGALSSVETGEPLFLCEMAIATAIRTAAMSALVARHLARKGSRSMAIIGCGAQCDFQILAFNALLGIKKFYLYDVDAAAMNKVVENLSEGEIEFVLPDRSINDSQASIRKVLERHPDIVTTVTADKTNATILTADMIRPGMHINAVGGDAPGKTELDKKILELEHARVVVEFEEQTRAEGEVQQMPPDFPVIEFNEIIRGIKPGRENSRQVTIHDSVGFALSDYAVLRLLYDKTRQYKLGTVVDLVPLETPDVKNLFRKVRKGGNEIGLSCDSPHAPGAKSLRHFRG
jgi:ornithine cyclodeaminase